MFHRSYDLTTLENPSLGSRSSITMDCGNIIIIAISGTYMIFGITEADNQQLNFGKTMRRVIGDQ